MATSTRHALYAAQASRYHTPILPCSRAQSHAQTHTHLFSHEVDEVVHRMAEVPGSLTHVLLVEREPVQQPSVCEAQVAGRAGLAEQRQQAECLREHLLPTTRLAWELSWVEQLQLCESHKRLLTIPLHSRSASISVLPDVNVTASAFTESLQECWRTCEAST